jgi:hypothetical protein
VYQLTVSSTVLLLLGNLPVGQHPLVCWLLKAFFREHPPLQCLFPAWSVRSALQVLDTWPPVKELSLCQLILKMAFLLALVTLKRPSDINHIHIREGYFELMMDCFLAQPLGIGKTDRPSHVGLPIMMEPFLQEPQICPVFYLNAYIKRTRPARHATSTRLFLSMRCPYAPVTPQTQARWLKEVLSLVGVVKAQARSV